MKDPVELWDSSVKAKISASYGINMGGGDGSGGTKVLEGLRLLKEMLYSEVGKNELGQPVYLFETIYDYQAILELKKWNSKGNFDRVSEMIIRALQWRLCDVKAAKELVHRKKTTVDNIQDDIWSRPWFI